MCNEINVSPALNDPKDQKRLARGFAPGRDVATHMPYELKRGTCLTYYDMTGS